MSKYLFILLCLFSLSACQASKEEKMTPTGNPNEVVPPPFSHSESPGLELPQEVATASVTPTHRPTATRIPTVEMTPFPVATLQPTPIISQRSLRLENLSAMEKANTFSLKLLYSYRYFGAFDFATSNLEEFFITLQKYEKSENYRALSLGATSKIIFFIKDHLQTEFEKDYLLFLNTRYQLSVQEALKILSENDYSKNLFSWKPRYLKKNNDITLQECEEVKRLLSNALEVKKIDPSLKLERPVFKRLKQMNQELPENELLKKSAQEIAEFVQDLISDL